MQQTITAGELRKVIGGSLHAHQARVRACLQWLELHRIPAMPVYTGGIPRFRRDGALELRSNPEQAGLADIVACLPPRGTLLLIEVKTGAARRSKVQREAGERFGNAGAISLLVRDVAELERLARDTGVA